MATSALSSRSDASPLGRSYRISCGSSARQVPTMAAMTIAFCLSRRFPMSDLMANRAGGVEMEAIDALDLPKRVGVTLGP